MIRSFVDISNSNYGRVCTFKTLGEVNVIGINTIATKSCIGVGPRRLAPKNNVISRFGSLISDAIIT